jgi:hypothetical protein
MLHFAHRVKKPEVFGKREYFGSEQKVFYHSFPHICEHSLSPTRPF